MEFVAQSRQIIEVPYQDRAVSLNHMDRAKMYIHVDRYDYTGVALIVLVKDGTGLVNHKRIFIHGQTKLKQKLAD